MTVNPNPAPEPTPTPHIPTSEAGTEDRRPDLHVVPDTPPAPDPPDPPPTPLAPLDVRVLQHLGEFLDARPRWSQRPPSPSEAWAYSTSGDWTTSDKSARRIWHGLCVLVAFAVTYPIDWAVQAVRQKPIGFVLALALLITISKIL